jgi:phospholipid/cholesterol/gamma-HCH transport system substrate-binding protein
MPRTRSLVWSELKIGVLTITAIAIAALTIFLLVGQGGFFWQRYSLKAMFDNVSGLNQGSPVRVAGVQVGSVSDVTLVGDRVEVTLQVKKSQRQRITTGSVAKLGSISLLGESAVDITPSTSGTPIPEWGYVPQGRASASIGDITEQAGKGIDEITKLVQDVRGGRGTVGKLMTDDRLYAELNRFVATAGEVTRGIQQGKGTLGKLITDPQAAESLEASLKNLETMTRQINAGEGTIGRLMKDDSLARALTDTTAKLKELTGNLNELTTRLNRGEGTAGKLMTDPTLFNRLNSLTDRFDQLLARINEGQGTVGLLLKDKQLYENMNGVVTDLRGFLTAVEKDPKKYLNVKISIF